MIYSKDRVSRETLTNLIAYSLMPECQFFIGIKPRTNIVNDHERKVTSVISFLKIEEQVFEFPNRKEGDKHGRAFSVKVLVEDYYLESPKEGSRNYGVRPVPATVLNKVAEILNVSPEADCVA